MILSFNIFSLSNKCLNLSEFKQIRISESSESIKNSNYSPDKLLEDLIAFKLKSHKFSFTKKFSKPIYEIKFAISIDIGTE